MNDEENNSNYYFLHCLGDFASRNIAWICVLVFDILAPPQK